MAKKTKAKQQTANKGMTKAEKAKIRAQIKVLRDQLDKPGWKNAVDLLKVFSSGKRKGGGGNPYDPTEPGQAGPWLEYEVAEARETAYDIYKDYL